jgi:hypothetical protein
MLLNVTSAPSDSKDTTPRLYSHRLKTKMRRDTQVKVTFPGQLGRMLIDISLYSVYH